MSGRLNIYVSLAVLSVLFFSPVTSLLQAESANVESRANKKWTFMVYLDADNNLDPWGHGDLDEMRAVGSDSNINIVVLWDGRGSGDGSLLYITQGGEDTFPVSDAGIPDEPDMADPATMEKFLDWAITEYPADHYLLSIWDHGSGIFRRGGDEEEAVKGFCNDDHGGGEIELWELNDVLSAAKTRAGKNIDIVGFDVCLLGHIETHYQIMPYVDYGIASEANEPGDGWDYETPLAALAQNPDMSPAALASHIVTAYLDFYSSGVTQAAVDLRALNNSLIGKLNDFAEVLTNYMFHYEDNIKSARSNAQAAGHNNDRDLYDFTRNIQQDGSLPAVVRNSASALLSEITAATVEEGQKGYSGAKGMVIYFPTGGPSNTYLNNIDMADTSWDEFLEEYSDPKLRYKMDIEVFDEDGDEHRDDVLITVSDFIGGIGAGAQIWVDGELIGTTDGEGKIYHHDSPKGIHTVRGLISGFEMNDVFQIANRPPTAMADIPGAVKAGEPMEFNGTLSSDPDDDLLSYIWKFGDGGGSAKANPVHVYEDDGIFGVSLTVIDTDSVESAPFTFEVTVENLPPQAYAGSDVSALEDEVIAFDGSGSWDTPQDKEGMQYMWDFGDGSATGWLGTPAINHSFSRGGASGTEISYKVKLSVKDDDDESSSDVLYVNVTNVIPEADAGAELTTLEDNLFTLSGANSTDSPSDIANLSYAWDFDDRDGLDYVDAEGMTAEHFYNESGVYTASLRITDDDGESDVDLVSINVLNVGPTAALPLDFINVTESELIGLDGSMCSDTPSDLPALIYIWEVDNGTNMVGKEANFTFHYPGLYNITLTVKDDDGESDSATVTVNVNNVPPMADLSLVDDPYEDDSVLLNASRSFDTPSDLGALRYRWDLDYDGDVFTPDATTGEPTLIHTFTESGKRTVMVMVVDDNGGNDTASVDFEVLNVLPVAVLNASSERCTEGDTLTFDGAETVDSESDMEGLAFEWRVDDVLMDSENRSFTYEFKRPGRYVVSLTVRDDDGKLDVDKVTVTVRERDRGGFGSSLLSPTLSNWGVFIYIAIFLVLLVVVVLVVVFRRRIRKEEAAVNRGEGTLKPDMEEVDAPVRTDEEKRREYQKLYGSASAGADTGKIRTGSTHHEENPFLVAGTDGGSDKHREEEYDLVFTAKDGDEDEEGYGKGHVYEEVYEDGGGREGSGDYEGGEVDDSTGLGEKSGNMEGEVTGTGAQRKGALQKAAAEEREKIALRTEKLKKLREKRKERRRKTLEKTRVNDIFDFLNDLADDVGDGGSNGVGDGAGDKGENTADEDLSGGDMEESLPEMDWDEDEEAMEGREEEQDATDQGDGEEVNGLKGWSI